MLRKATSGPSRSACAVGASGRRDRPGVCDGEHEHPDGQRREEEAPLGQAAQRQPGERRPGDQRGGDDEQRAGRHGVPRRPPLAAGGDHELEPVRRAAGDVEQVDLADDVGAALDPVEERGRVPAQDDERPEPPGARGDHRSRPPPRGRGAPPPAPGQQPEPGGHGGEDRGGGVHPAAAEHREAGERGGPARPDAALGGEDDGQQDGRGEEDGERLRRQAADGRQHPGAERVGERADHPGGGAADPQGREQGVGREQTDGEQQAPPQPLGHPDGQRPPRPRPKNGPIGKR